MNIELSLVVFVAAVIMVLAWVIAEVRKRHWLGLLCGLLAVCAVVAFNVTLSMDRLALFRKQELVIARSMLTAVETGKTGTIHEAWGHYMDHLTATPPGYRDVGRGCLSMELWDATTTETNHIAQPEPERDGLKPTR